MLVIAVNASAQQPTADLIASNAKVHTVDKQRPAATALAVKDAKVLSD